MDNSLKRRVRTKALAERNSVSQAQVRDWFHEGIIPGIQIGKTILFDPIEVDQALESFKRHAKTIATQ